jgi:L-ascorbate metabolism protein UlaG (beta-lactamase superfamily)
MNKRILAVIVAGVLGAFSVAAAAHDRDDDDRDDRGGWKPVDPALVKARQKFFGIENVDSRGRVNKDKVIFSWSTNTTYVVSVKGRVLMLDSYLLHVELPTDGPIDRRRTKALPKDFVDLKPEAIFLGHGHGDHADNAAYVAKWTGATIYASPETCDVMQQDVTRMWNDPNEHNGGAKIIPNGDPVDCVGAVPRNSPPGEYTGTLENPTGGTTRVRRIRQFDRDLCILAFKHIHSGNAPVDPSFVHSPLNDLADPRDAGRVFTTPAVTYPALYPTGIPYTPPGNPASRVPGQLNTTTTGFGGAAGIIEIGYHFVLRGDNNFAFSYINSAGPAKEGIGSGSPGLISLAQYNDPVNNGPAIALAAEIGKGLFSLMEDLPQTDVMLGSVISLGANNNQQRDIISYIQRLKPRVFIPGHFSAVAQRGSSPYYLVNWRETAQAMGFAQSDWPELRWMVDPLDYFRPLVYDPDDKRWAKSHHAEHKYRAHCR